MKLKRILALLLALVMLCGLAACGEPEAKDDDKETTTAANENTSAGDDETTTGNDETTGEEDETTVPQGKYTITVRVVHKDGSEKTFTYHTDEEYLGDVLLDAGLIQGSDGPYGLDVSHVDGEKAVYNEDKAYWALYEGDQYAMQGVSTTPVVDGAEYSYVYTEA